MGCAVSAGRIARNLICIKAELRPGVQASRPRLGGRQAAQQGRRSMSKAAGTTTGCRRCVLRRAAARVIHCGAMHMRWYAIPLLLTASLGLTACAGTRRPALNRCEPGNCPPATEQGFLRFTLGFYPGWAPYAAWGMPVNGYLWRGALDTLGFMPLDSVDPMDGMIITEWVHAARRARRAAEGAGLHPGPCAKPRQSADQRVSPGAAERTLGGCGGQPADGGRVGERGAGPRSAVVGDARG